MIEWLGDQLAAAQLVDEEAAGARFGEGKQQGGCGGAEAGLGEELLMRLGRNVGEEEAGEWVEGRFVTAGQEGIPVDDNDVQLTLLVGLDGGEGEKVVEVGFAANLYPCKWGDGIFRNIIVQIEEANAVGLLGENRIPAENQSSFGAVDNFGNGFLKSSVVALDQVKLLVEVIVEGQEINPDAGAVRKGNLVGLFSNVSPIYRENTGSKQAGKEQKE